LSQSPDVRRVVGYAGTSAGGWRPDPSNRWKEDSPYRLNPLEMTCIGFTGSPREFIATRVAVSASASIWIFSPHSSQVPTTASMWLRLDFTRNRGETGFF
jgi:hypothetical protein